MRLTILAIAAVIPLALAACQKQLEAPADKGVCWHLASTPDGVGKFNVLAQNQPDLEHCAAELEKMRLRFMALGGNQQEIVGAYQGQFVFLQREGVFTAQSYNGVRYPFLVRTGDGRLATPGAMPTQ